MSRFVALTTALKIIQAVVEFVRTMILSSRNNDEDEGSED